MKKKILQQSLDTPTWQFSDGEGHSALSLLKGRWVRVKGKPRGILKSFDKSLARTKQTLIFLLPLTLPNKIGSENADLHLYPVCPNDFSTTI